MKQILIFLACAMGACCSLNAQESPENKALFHEIYDMDSLLFNAFNNRDVETLAQIFSKDLEFYHDKGGLSNYDQNMAAFKENFAKPDWPTRELVKESMEVYPIPNYGAVQTGEHVFCHPENGQMGCWTFKFVSIWHKTAGRWELARVVSFDH